MSVLMFLDGVLRKNKDKSPIFEGLNLYRGMNEVNRVIILAEDKEKADVWFKQNTLNAKLDDIIGPSTLLSDEPQLQQVIDCQVQGKVELVVTADSDLAVKLLERGIPTLVFIHPKYTRPEFRPDAREGVRSWEAITAELDKQQGLMLEDARLFDEEELTVIEEEE